jgi:hypothetical protein
LTLGPARLRRPRRPPQHASKPAAHPSPHATAGPCQAGSPVPAGHQDAASRHYSEPSRRATPTG